MTPEIRAMINQIGQSIIRQMDEKLDISTYSGWLDDGRRWTVTVNNKPTVPELVLHVDHLEVGGEKFDDLGTVRVRRSGSGSRWLSVEEAFDDIFGLEDQ